MNEPNPFALSFKYARQVMLKVIRWRPIYIETNKLMIMRDEVLKTNVMDATKMFAVFNEVIFRTIKDHPEQIDQFHKGYPTGNGYTSFYQYTVQMAFTPNQPERLLFLVANKDPFEHGTIITQNEPYLWVRPTPIQIIQYRKIGEPLLKATLK